MTEDEVIERLNNLEDKILNNEQLSDNEALDIAFLPMFAPKGRAEFVTEKLTRLFREDVSITGVFRNDIAFGLSIMIRKYFDCTSKGKELLKLIEPELDTSRLKDVIDFEADFIKKSYEKELVDKDNAIVEKDEQISILKAKLKENGIE